MSDEWDLLRYARFYWERGINVIPTYAKSKKAAVEWSKYQETFASEGELERWFKGKKIGELNISMVVGKVSGNLVVLDFDSKEKYEEFMEKLKDRDFILWGVLRDTWIAETGRGYHIHFRVENLDDIIKKWSLSGSTKGLGEVFVKGHLAVAPPSIHETGKRYRFIDEEKILYGEKQLKEILPEQFEEILEILGIIRERKTASYSYKPREWRELDNSKIEEIFNLLKEFYTPGHRELLVGLYLSALFIKSRVKKESLERIARKLAEYDRDNNNSADWESTLKGILRQIEYHYEKRIHTKGEEGLKGASGIREEMEEILRSRGYPEEEIVRKVSETIAKLYTLLGLSRGPGVVWIERKGGFIRKWVAIGRQGVYVFRRKDSEDEPIVQIVSNVKIREVKAIRILGLDLRNLYLVRADGESFTGTIDEILNYIEKYYGLERGARYSIARLIEYSSIEEEELYYSPGPWVVDGKIVYAKVPGYTPPWKPYQIWNPPPEVDVESKKRALETIRNLVDAYKDPSKPSLVLSYAAISPIMHYVKRVLNIAPHLIITGLENSGKSVLLDFIKLLYNISWTDPFPGSDYQARRMLSLSTFPAIIDEINELIKGYQNDERKSREAIDMLHRAATQELLRQSGGHQYGGYYLAIRSMIAATNSDITLVPWALDKFIITTISTKHGIRVEKAVGYTPRTMKPEVKKAIPNIGMELLGEIEKLLDDIEKLKNLSRDEIRDKLIEIGYQAWVNLYWKYGLKPFPPPSKPETDLERTGVKEQYEDILNSYINRCKENEGNKDKSIPYLFEATVKSEDELRGYVEARKHFETNLGIIVKNTLEGREYLLCKTSFLTKFKEWAAKEYGIPKMGWKRLSEILGMSQTMRTIGGKQFKNILIKELE